jgi:hypothetical protein
MLGGCSFLLRRRKIAAVRLVPGVAGFLLAMAAIVFAGCGPVAEAGGNPGSAELQPGYSPGSSLLAIEPAPFSTLCDESRPSSQLETDRGETPVAPKRLARRWGRIGEAFPLATPISFERCAPARAPPFQRA